MGVAEAARRTIEGGSARFEEGFLWEPALLREDDVRTRGSIDFARRQARFVAAGLSRSSIARMRPRMRPRSPLSLAVHWLLKLFVRIATTPLEYVFVDDHGYVLHAKHGRMDLGTESSHVNPVWVLDLLAEGRADLAPVGEDDARGDLAAHHEGTVDAGVSQVRLPASLQPEGDPARGRWLARMPAHVWIDREGRVRRVALAPLGPGKDGQMLWDVIEFFDFGAEVEVSLP